MGAVPARVSDVFFLKEKMIHGNKKSALGPCEDSCCNVEVRIVCVCL